MVEETLESLLSSTWTRVEEWVSRRPQLTGSRVRKDWGEGWDTQRGSVGPGLVESVK